MSAPKNIAEAIRAERMIDAAWEAWLKGQPSKDAPDDEQDAWQAGWEAFEEASFKARTACRELPCSTLTMVSAKLSWLLTEDADNTSLAAYEMVLRDLTAILDRPTQDAFAVKLARYYEACGRRDAYEAAHRPAQCEGLPPEWQAFESAMFPLHNAVFDAGRAVLLEPAPDMAAMLAKRDIFDALEFWSVGDEPDVFRRLFADAIALAGGAA